MMGAAKAHYDCDVPVLVMDGDDDQICPFESSGAKAVKLLKHGTLKLYPGFPHGMPTTSRGANQRRPADILQNRSRDGCGLSLSPAFTP